MEQFLGSDPQEAEIRGELNRILKAPRFRNSPRAREFLRFVIDETLAGRGEKLNQFSIGTGALGRGDNFFPTEDPIVRMQATRVRRALENFYLTEGSDNPVIISLPTGCYQPEFRRRNGSAKKGGGRVPENWPTLLLRALRNLTGNPDFDFMTAGVVDDLALELGHYSGLRVFLDLEEGSVDGESEAQRLQAPADFELIGSLSQVGPEIRFSVHLLRVSNGEQLWADTFRFSQPDEELVAIRSELPHRIAAAVAEEQGPIARHAGCDPIRADCTDAGVYEAVLQGYYAERNVSPERMAQAIDALSVAAESNGECGLVWTMLSRLWSINFSYEVLGRVDSNEKAIECGLNAVRLCPRDISARTVLAYAFLLDDQVKECRREVELAVENSPHTFFFMDAVGYLLVLSGDWERGSDISREAIRRNPFPRHSVYAGLWLDAIRREDYGEAIRQAELFGHTGSFWTPLMRLVARVLSEDKNYQQLIEREAADLLRCRPDFEESGRRLMAKYQKFPDLQVRLEEGLAGGGIVLK